MTSDSGAVGTSPEAGTGPLEAEVATSYEARWFFDGEPPPAVVRAFLEGVGHGEAGDGSAGRPAETEAEWPRPRTDRYLPFAADMGIKVRAEPDRPAKLEFKGRQRLDGPVELAPGVVGVASTWIKWSYPAEDVFPPLLGGWAAEDDPLQPDGSARAVVKRRLLRLFRLDEGALPREVPPDQRLPRGVQLELARLRLPSVPGGRDAPRSSPPGHPAGPERTAWTVGFEGFPLGPGLEAAVHAAVSAPLLRLASAGADLDRAHSASYPEWLTR